MCVEVQGGLGRPPLDYLRLPPRRCLALLGQLQQLEPDLSDARVNQANLPGYTIGYINFAALPDRDHDR